MLFPDNPFVTRVSLGDSRRRGATMNGSNVQGGNRDDDWGHLDKGKMERPLPEDVRKILEACVSHATELMAAAKLLKGGGFLNFAYHLATLCLEEVGKAHLIFMNFLVAERSGDNRAKSWDTDDHVKKLFWALFSPLFGKELITRKLFESLQGLAKQIHERRLQGLYVDPSAEEFARPKETISNHDLDNLFDLVQSRLDTQRPFARVPLTQEERAVLDWYVKAGDDPEKRQFIMSSESMNKLVEIGNAVGWMRWMKDTFEEGEHKAMIAAQRELERPEPSADERLDDKWQLRIRLVTASHSLRRREIAPWNTISRWIRLIPVDRKKNELIVEFTLPKCIPVAGVWSAGMELSTKFVIALNMGTLGFFWWYIPRDVSRYYEKLTDLETDHEVTIERRPKLAVDWPHKRLNQQMLNNVALAFGMIPNRGQREECEPFNLYAVALALMAKSDIHLQLEMQSFLHFYDALKTGTRIYGDWDGESPFGDTMHELLDPVLGNAEEVERYHALGARPSEMPLKPGDITLREVAGMKLLADAYFVMKFQRMATERQNGGGQQD